MFSYIDFVLGLQAISLLSDQRQQSAALMSTKPAKRLFFAHSEFSFTHYEPTLSSNSVADEEAKQVWCCNMLML